MFSPRKFEQAACLNLNLSTAKISREILEIFVLHRFGFLSDSSEITL